MTVVMRTPSRSERDTLEPSASDLDDTIEAIRANASDRLVYRYSVIPGGVYTGDELRSAIQDDPVVAAHYRDLDQSKLQVRTVTRDRYAYVSYRKGDEVFWTKHKVLVRQGETVVTDGTKQIRAKCGNCISEAPQLPTADNEPEEVEFDRLTEPVAQQPRVSPEVALVPLAPSDAVSGPVAGESVEALDLLGTGRFGSSALPPFAVAGTDAPGPSLDLPGPETPLPPIVPEPPAFFPPPPGVFTPPDMFPTPPGGLFPPSGDNPPLDQPIPPVPPIDVPPSEPVTPVPVPEPGTLLLIAAGAVTAAYRRRSRSR